jgi:hypothetical protein
MFTDADCAKFIDASSYCGREADTVLNLPLEFGEPCFPSFRVDHLNDVGRGPLQFGFPWAGQQPDCIAQAQIGNALPIYLEHIWEFAGEPHI